MSAHNKLDHDEITIVLPKHDFCYPALKSQGYEVLSPYKGNVLPLRLLRELHFRSPLPGKSIWYNKKLKKINCAIVYDALITTEYMQWLRKKNPDSRLIYLYSNPVDKAIDPRQLPDSVCEKWTTDKKESEEYGIEYIGDGGYIRTWTVKKEEPEYDVFFIGRDKGRLDKLTEIKDRLESLGLTTNFYITAYHRYQRFGKKAYKPLVPYTDVLKMLGKTRSILHLVDGGQSGITFRVMESIIHGIKLITDNRALKDSIYYNPHNFFILGDDDLSDLPAFLQRPFMPYPQELVDKLYYENAIIKRIKEETSADRA